jgi:hypothetical protein
MSQFLENMKKLQLVLIYNQPLTPFYLPVVSAGNDRGKGFNAKDNLDILTDQNFYQRM